jgi:DNA mismatch endonuclease, patch repair protein
MATFIVRMCRVQSSLIIKCYKFGVEGVGMADVHSRAVRSFNMSRIGNKNTKPEMLIRRFLFAQGLRYRLHLKTLPGKPDLVFPKLKTVLFVHGCFWHGHSDCKYFVIPKTKTSWWIEKISRNQQVDERNFNTLIDLGWRVIVIFECELKPKARLKTFEKIINLLAIGNSSH